MLYSGIVFKIKNIKGHNLKNSVGRVKVLVHCILSDDALYLYKVPGKHFLVLKLKSGHE